MTSYGNSAARQAAAIRAQARRGWWRWLLARLGVTAHTRRADAQAARWQVGAQAEDTTRAMLRPLEAAGWRILHDRQLPGSRANLDHVLVSPCGTAVVVLDTKRWHAGRETVLLRGRVHCGVEDRQGQVEAVASYAARVARVLGLPSGAVWPLLVVHGSRIRGGRLEARAPEWSGVVHVLGPEFLVPTLANSPTSWNPEAAVVLAEHVARVLPPYVG